FEQRSCDSSVCDPAAAGKPLSFLSLFVCGFWLFGLRISGDSVKSPRRHPAHVQLEPMSVSWNQNGFFHQFARERLGQGLFLLKQRIMGKLLPILSAGQTA
ncbi:hypothetical protein ANANG_G00279660, partial [Anguilla anguilla]